MRRILLSVCALGLVFACQPDEGGKKPIEKVDVSKPPEAEAPGKKKIQPPLPPAKAPQPDKRLAAGPEIDGLRDKIASYFDGNIGRRIYIQVDKPLYKPGETVWIKTWDLMARDLGGKHGNKGIRYQLVSPKGAVVLRKERVQESNGVASNDFVIPEGVQGGEYQVRAISFDGHQEERPIIVSSYEPPRIKKKLEFVRKAYGAGDEVTATIEVKRPTGEPLVRHPLVAAIRLDGQDLPRVRLKTNDQGGGLVKFKLPGTIEIGDGLLTVLVKEGGVTESVSKRIPIVLKKLQFAMFPEGGQLVAGLPGRVYIEAKNMIGKPADVEGRVKDDHGNTVATFKSYHHGMGRFDIRPATGRRYTAEITKPVGITEQYDLPAAVDQGCTLASFDDFDGQDRALRVAVSCKEQRKVHVVGMLRENLIDSATVQVAGGGKHAVVYLQSKDPKINEAQGIARVTVFDEELNPLAERLVYRNRRNLLGVKVKAHKKTYAPRDQVTLNVTTTDHHGQPVPAELALSVVDDTVVSFADDKTGHMLSRLYLEPELQDKVEEPNIYFDLKEKKSAVAMDLLMGTRGWRKFEWRKVLHPAPALADVLGSIGTGGGAGLGDMEGALAGLDGIGIAKGGEGGLGRRGAGRGAGGAKLGKMKKRNGGDRHARRGNGGGVRKKAKRARGGPAGRAAGPPRKPARHRPAARRPAAHEPAAPPPPRAALAAPEAVAEAEPPADRPARRAKREEAKEKAPMEEQARARRRAVAQDRVANKGLLKVLGAEDDNGERPDVLGGGGKAADLDEAFRDVRGVGTAKTDKDWAGAATRSGAARKRPRNAWAPVRVFPAPQYGGVHDGPRTDFRETIHWAPDVKTGRDGQTTLTLYLSDAITSFRIFTEGVSGGFAGRDETVIRSSLPFSMNVKLPVATSAGDRLELPLTLTNETNKPLDVNVGASFGELLDLEQAADGQRTVKLKAGERQSLYYKVKVREGARGKSEVSFSASAGSLVDEFHRTVTVEQVGFPQETSRSGQVKEKVGHEIDLGEAVPGTVTASLRVYPSPVSTMVSGLNAMLRQPTGCFEQASSSNYPNVMVMRYLKEHDVADVGLMQRSQRLLDSGYRKISGFECKQRGYEWFGGDPGHEALTAYGLLEFADMRRVYGGVDKVMLDRTAAWLLARRDGQGGYKRNKRALDSFGRASPEVTDAYITYSMAEAGYRDLEREIEKQARLARDTQDAYLLALAANTMLRLAEHKAEGKSAADRLSGMQEKSGAWTKADHSITRSGGKNLHVETTALAMMALLRAGGHGAGVRKAVGWLRRNRGGYGNWGATQATVLGLKAMAEYARVMRRAHSPGTVVVQVNGQEVARKGYKAGRRKPLIFTDIGAAFKAGRNEVVLLHDGKGELPYSLAVEFRSAKPASAAEAVADLQTSIERQRVKMGENVRVTATVRNKTDQGQPMTLARIGLPGGLAFQTWQLKELKDKKLIAFYETRPREVVLYLRQLKPGETRELPLDLVATVPGEYTGPASRAYLYYTDEHKDWTDPIRIAVTK